MRVVWTDAALAGIEQAYDDLFPFNPAAAMDVAATIRAEGDSLVTFPHRGRAVLGTAMRELAASHRYILRYRVDGDTVVILRVRHSSRRRTKP